MRAGVAFHDGTAALAVCRPLPFLETPEPRLRDVIKEVFKKDVPTETAKARTSTAR